MIPITKAISIPLNFISFILLIFLFIISKIKCADSICEENPSSCKKTLLYPDFSCPISGSETNKYFYVENVNNAGNKICKTTDKCPSQNLDKVVASTNECVLNCADLIEIGDFCFKQDEIDLRKYKKVPFTNKYICPEYTYIKLIDEKKYLICIDDPSKVVSGEKINVNAKCPSLYYDVDEKICKESCGNKKITKSVGKYDNTNFDYYECRNECEYKEETIGGKTIKTSFEYYESIDESNSNKIYCESQCPSKTPYYYSISGKISPKCIKKCETKHFYNNDKECSPYCDKFYIVENSQSVITFNKKTYSYEEGTTTTKKCVDDCFLYDTKPYSDDESLSCVEKCSQTSNIFHYNHKCYKSCSDINDENDGNQYYYIKTSLEPITEPEGDNELECVAECPNNYYLLSDEICIKYCPKSSENSYANIKEKKCTTCKKEEGFILYSELTEVTTSPKNIFCYESCPPDTYYKINDNSLRIIKQYVTLLVKIFQEAIYMKIIIYALKNLTVEINTIIKLEN